MMVEPSSVEDSVGVPTSLIEYNGITFFPKTLNKEIIFWCNLLFLMFSKSSNKISIETFGLNCNKLFVSGRTHNNVVRQARNRWSKISG